MDKAEADNVYALTGGHDDKCIANGNTWAESEVKDNGVLGAGTRQTEKNKIGSNRKYKIAVDFDGRREDGEYLDGRVVQAEDEDEALQKFIKEFPELKTFEGYCILDDEGEVVN